MVHYWYCVFVLGVIWKLLSSVFLITAAARTSEGKSDTIKLIDSLHLGRWDTDTG